MLFINVRWGGFSRSAHAGSGRLLFMIVWSLCLMSTSVVVDMFVFIFGPILEVVCLFSHFFHSWHHGFQISFLKRVIIELIRSTAACTIFFGVVWLVVHDIGTSPRIKWAWYLGSGWKKVFPIGSGSKLLSSCASSLVSMVVRLILVRVQISTCAVVSCSVQYRHLVDGYLGSYSFFLVAVGSLSCKTFALKVLVRHPVKVLVPPAKCPSSFHVIAVAGQSVCQRKSGLICFFSVSSCHWRMVVAWALFLIHRRGS